MGASKSRVTKAGELLRAHRLGIAPLGPREYLREQGVVEEFRARHAVSLTRVAAGLRYYVDSDAHGEPWSVGQRLKAMPTILDKLVRQPKMELARMHDVGGCRGILPDQDAVDRVIVRLRRRWQLRDHVWDYVSEPKEDGYRAKHLGRANADVKQLFVAISELLRLQEAGGVSDVEFVKRVTELASPNTDGNTA